MENFPSNSHNEKKAAPVTKREPKKVEKVVSGGVVRRKKPLSKKFADIFIGESAKSVWRYIAFDVLVPAAKDMVYDAFSQGLDRTLFGDTRHRHGSSRSHSSGSYISYNRFGSNPYQRAPEPRREMSRRGRATHDFDEIILETRVEAEEVINRLFDLISQYETATVADLYEMLGQSGNFTDEKWGWVDIRGAGVTRVRGGYLLDLPRPEPLD